MHTNGDGRKPLDLAALLQESVRVEVGYGGHTFGVQYKPHAVTTALYVELQALAGKHRGDDEAAFDALAEILPRFIADWEITVGGEPLPVDKAAMQRFPLQMLLAVSDAVMGHMRDPNTAARPADATPSPSGPAAGGAPALAPSTGTP